MNLHTIKPAIPPDIHDFARGWERMVHRVGDRRYKLKYVTTEDRFYFYSTTRDNWVPVSKGDTKYYMSIGRTPRWAHIPPAEVTIE